MSRSLPFLLFAVLAGALFLIPPADPARLAALDAWPIDEDSDDFARFEALAEEVFAGPSVVRGADGQPTLHLRGVRLISDRGPYDLNVHGLARRSIVRGLRQVAAGRGESLSVEGELIPVRAGAAFLVRLERDTLTVRYEPSSGEPLEVVRTGYDVPRRTALIPPLIAILMAIVFRRPVLALFVGVWSATFLARWVSGAGAASSVALGLPDVFRDLFWPELVDPARMRIVGFVFAMLAMVGVMTRSGGMRGLMDLVARFAHDVRSTQLATWAMGLIVFFDDYANCTIWR